MIRSAIRRWVAPARRLRGRRAIGSGQFNRARPLSREFGYDRGTPIDRYYIEAFVEANATAIHGRVLEIGSDTYSRRFGQDRVTKQDILHIHSGNSRATLIGDLSRAETLPDGAFDCMILTQTLHLIYDMREAVHQVRRALGPGGVALITVPGVSSIDRGEWGGSWHWSLTQTSLERLLREAFGPKEIEISTQGNLFAATAFLHGACVEEIDAARLDLLDDAYPVTIAAVARRTS